MFAGRRLDVRRERFNSIAPRFRLGVDRSREAIALGRLKRYGNGPIRVRGVVPG